MDKQLVLFENKNILDQEKFPSRKTRMIKVECNQRMYLQSTVCFSTNLGSILLKKGKIKLQFIFQFHDKNDFIQCTLPPFNCLHTGR